MLCIEIQISSSSSAQQEQIVRQIGEVVSNAGFSVDRSEFTPTSTVQAELAAVETSRATIKTFEG